MANRTGKSYPSSGSAGSTFRWTDHDAERTSWKAKYINGVYLGLRLGTYDVYIGTATGVVIAAAIKHKAEAERLV